MTSKPGLAVDYVKVDRRCPRCNAHRYHNAKRKTVDNRHVVSINCAECGHDWTGRFKRSEWSDDLK